MNLSLDSGNTPRSFRLFRLAEHSTPDRSFESCSRFIDIGSINGVHLHKLCRPVSECDAKENCRRTQGLEPEKLNTNSENSSFTIPLCGLHSALRPAPCSMRRRVGWPFVGLRWRRHHTSA